MNPETTTNNTTTPEQVTGLLKELKDLKVRHDAVAQTGFQLISTQTKLQSLLHNASDGIITFNADGTVQTFNLAAQKIFGYGEAEIVTRKIPDLIPCPDWHKDNIANFLREFIASRSSENLPVLGRNRQGDDILLQVSSGQSSQQDTTLFEKDTFNDMVQSTATEELSVFFFRDITFNKKLERELNDHKYALDLVAGVVIFNKQLKIVNINDTLCQKLKTQKNKLIGLSQSDLTNTHIDEEISNSLQQGNAWSGELCYCTDQCSPVWFSASITPLKDENNQVYRYLSILFDITSRKTAEIELEKHKNSLQELVDEQVSELKQAKEIAERANHAKSDFLSNMSHELRTPMHAILSFSKLGMKQFETSPVKPTAVEKLEKFMSHIHTSGTRLLRLLDDLLDLAKLEAGKVEYNFAENDLYPLAQQIGVEFSAKLAEKNIQLSIQPPDINVSANFDRDKLAQVISNLLSNAIKFTENGKCIGIFLSTTKTPSGRRKSDSGRLPAILFEITDQGLGIPDTELATVFDKFIQSSKTNTGAGGTGLGLAICQEIIEAHGGSIWAENNPDGGATIKFALPKTACTTLE